MVLRTVSRSVVGVSRRFPVLMISTDLPLVRRRTALLIAAVAIVLTACSGDDDADSTIPPPVTSDTLFVTTTVDDSDATDPTVSSTTDDPGSTAPSTDPPPATDATAPSTTAAPVDDDVQAVIDGLVASWNAFNEIKLDPTSDDKFRVVAETHRGELLDRVLEIVSERRLMDRRSIPNPDVPTEILPRAGTVAIDGNLAEVEYCWINSNILVETAGNPDGSDLVLDDSVSAVVQRDTLELIDGKWIRVDSVDIDTVPGETSCSNVA
jgi:hypothetical protein